MYFWITKDILGCKWRRRKQRIKIDSHLGCTVSQTLALECSWGLWHYVNLVWGSDTLSPSLAGLPFSLCLQTCIPGFSRPHGRWKVPILGREPRITSPTERRDAMLLSQFWFQIPEKALRSAQLCWGLPLSLFSLPPRTSGCASLAARCLSLLSSPHTTWE